jgi:hypothetical protein
LRMLPQPFTVTSLNCGRWPSSSTAVANRCTAGTHAGKLLKTSFSASCALP